MITDRASALGELAGEVLTLRKSQQHGQALARRRELVDNLAVRAAAASGARQVLASRLDESLPPLPAVDAAVAQVATWRAALNDDVAFALGGDQFQSLQAVVQRAVAELEAAANLLWQRYTTSLTPETSDDVLAALEADADARSTVRQIRRLGDSLARLRERVVPTREEIAEYAAAAAEIREAWATLDVASLDPEVVSFLRGANGDRGAPLASLTPTVSAWLQERGASGHYVIRPADR